MIESLSLICFSKSYVILDEILSRSNLYMFEISLSKMAKEMHLKQHKFCGFL